MILVTIGTMLPFDRLVQAADAWAANHPEQEVVAQIGDQGVYEPKHMRWMRMVGPQEFANLVDECQLLIAHAGTGSFFLAAERSRPIVLFPRRAAYREHTTDHQVHTARWLQQKPGVHVAMTEAELPEAIAAGLAQSDVVVNAVPPHAPDAFLARLREALVA